MTYNGWKNYETWNVALWLNNDEGLHALVKEHNDYTHLVNTLNEMNIDKTPDGVFYNDDTIDFRAINDLMTEINDGEQ